ncbi:enolase-phosphatase E1-like [Hetaerina americana]|uniref:enolase-phosphatase E1-like n=1 Tax=Hetaerina americana TaxID=62018 RepID=UPI003A7F154D
MGCLQSYFRKGSYDVYEAHSTGLSPSPSSAAAAAVSSAKPSTPPGSNGHAPEGVAEDSPPPRPPPKRSHEAKALAAAKEPDPSQPPALPPKRHSKASSGSQTVKVEPQQTGVEPGGTASKTDGDSAKTPSSPVKTKSEESTASPEQVQEKAASPSEGISRTSPPNDTLVSEATDTPGGTNSSAALSPLKNDDGSTSQAAEDGTREEQKSPGTGDAQDGSHMSTPAPLEAITPTSVVISPPGDPEGSLGEEISPLQESPKTPRTEVQERSRDTPTSRPQSTADTPEAAVTSPRAESTEVVKDDIPRPNSVTSKEMESMSVVSGSIVTDSAIVEDKESPSEAAVKRSSRVEEGPAVSAEGVATPKGRDSGLSSEEGSTPIVVERADDSGQGPAVAAGEAREGPTDESAAAIDVSVEVNKSESGGAGGSSRPVSAVEEKTEKSPVPVDECGNLVVGETAGQKEGEEGGEGGTKTDDVDGEEVGKSFGFGDSASLDTVVHVKTESSTEIPNASSQEKAASPQEETAASPKSAGEMPVTEDGGKETVEVSAETSSPTGPKEISEEVRSKAEVSSPPVTAMDSSGSREEPTPTPPAKETEESSPPVEKVSPSVPQDETTQSCPVKDESSPKVEEEGDSVMENTPPKSPTKHTEASSPIAMAADTSVSQNEPTPPSPGKEETSSPPAQAESTPVPDSEPPPATPTKKVEASSPTAGDSSPSQMEPTPPSPSKEEKDKAASEDKGDSQEEEKPAPKEDAIPESPKEKSSEQSNEELPPPPPPEAEKEDEQQGGEVMPPPPPPDSISAEPKEAPQTEAPKSQERPMSVTEEEVASILLSQSQEMPTVDTKGGEREKEEDQKDLPPPPPSTQDGNQEGDFPPPPDMSEDGEIRSPEDPGGRTRSASFELVEVLNLGGSLEEGEEGAKKDDDLREGRGLVKRVPTPVNTDWPPNQEDEEEEEERDSISPEATATPSVTSESKQSLEEAEVAGSKMAKDAATGSLEGISEVASQGGQAEEEEAAKGATETVTEAKEVTASEVEVKSGDAKATEPSEDAKETPKPTAPDEEVFVAVEGGENVPADVEVPECTVTNQGPPPEVLKAAEEKLKAEELHKEEEEKEERIKSPEELRKELEELGRLEVDEACRKAVVEVERRDRESRMSAEALDDDKAAVEAATNGHDAESVEEGRGEKDTPAKEEAAKTPDGEHQSNGADDQTDKLRVEESGKETPEVSKDEAKVNDDDAKKAASPEAEVEEVKAGNETPEAARDAPTPEKKEKAGDSPEATIDPAVASKVKTPPKSKAEGEINGEAENERRSAAQSEEVQSPRDDAAEEEAGTIEGGGKGAGRSKEEAAAIKIQSTFRGYAVRRDAGKAVEGGVGGPGEGKEGGAGGEGACSSGAAVVSADESGDPLAVVPSEPSPRHATPVAADVDDREEDKRVWERLEREREDQAAACIQRGYREYREAAAGGKRLRREDALTASTNSSASSSFPAYSLRTSGEFHDHVVLPPIESADLAGDTGGMRQGCGVPTEGSGGPQGDVGARGLMDSAAARIQAGYRGYRVRKRLREVQNNGPSNHRDSPSNGMEGGDGKGKEGEAATKIQAGVRGFLTRRRLKRRREEDCENQGTGDPGEVDGGRRSAGENPPGAEEAEKAAVKIQAGFRGYKGRQKAKARRQQDGKKEVK